MQTPLEKAQLAKNEGNKCFKNRDYKEALKHYSEAIELCPKDATMDLATFYQNRAATHEYLVRAACLKSTKMENLHILHFTHFFREIIKLPEMTAQLHWS